MNTNKKILPLSELLSQNYTRGKTVPMSRIAKLYKAIDKKHPYEITDDFQDGYDLAISEIDELIRDVLKGE